ncbi:ABC transporter permease [Streptomyces sp. NPDC058231]|uniref:ABC transporter permease n=1 Tax=Streptomyces sp. NPDC058231 TaxID=3346392 RepID=UPI0036E4A34A
MIRAGSGDTGPVGLPPFSRLRVRDGLGEALAGLVQRPGRSVLTMLGTVLGVGAFVAVLGLTSTATQQIGDAFNALTATTVTIQAHAAAGTTGRTEPDFPADADERVQRLNGVASAGVWWQLSLRNPSVSTRPAAPAESSVRNVRLFAASPGALEAAAPTVATGRLYNEFHRGRAEQVCVLGSGAARLLGISRVDNQPVVFINSTPYSVVGILSDVERLPDFLLGVMIPESTALRAYGPPTDSPAQMLIHTDVGAAKLIARQAPPALRPDRPDLLTAVPPPDPHGLRDTVDTSLSGLFLVLAGICLVIGAVGIANTTLVAVLERRGEIGLRRALGAGPRHIAAQFLTESTVLGTLGGLTGTAIGVGVVATVSLAQDWTAVISPYTVLPAPVIGSLTGLLAGLYPALRAAKVEPLEALRT